MAVLGAQRLGPWRLLRRIAVGGMAELFEARWEDSEAEPPAGVRPGVSVCIKRPLPQVSEDVDLRGAFEAAGGLALGVLHPNVVRTYAVERVPWGTASPYLVMELVEGTPLSALLDAALERGAGLAPERVARLGRDIARGLACLHALSDADGASLKFVHRDVTPHNVMVRADGSAVLVDLDLARFRDRPGHTSTGVVKGKQAYATPEQIDGGPVGPRSDLFSLGVVLWELAAGRRLFLADDPMETLERVRDARVPDLSGVAPACPPELCEVIMECLQRAPGDRPGSASLVAERLHRVLEGPGGGLAAARAAAPPGALPSESSGAVSADPPRALRPLAAALVTLAAAAAVAFVVASSLWYLGQVAP